MSEGTEVGSGIGYDAEGLCKHNFFSSADLCNSRRHSHTSVSRRPSPYTFTALHPLRLMSSLAPNITLPTRSPPWIVPSLLKTITEEPYGQEEKHEGCEVETVGSRAGGVVAGSAGWAR